MASIKTLIQEFHNLNGDTLREKYTHFQQFLSRIKQNFKQSSKEDQFISELKAENEIEELFIIDILLNLKRNRELLEIIKSGNGTHIGRILKNFQFFADVIPKFTATELIEDLFPHTSFIVRMKITNRIYKTVKNEQLLDEYFAAIEKKYGFRSAFALLPGCSKQLIRSKIIKYGQKLSARHAIEIYKKDPKFLQFYFEFLKKNDPKINIFSTYPSVVKYLLRKNKQLFWELQKQFEFTFKCGRHLTKNIMLSNLEVLENGERCIEWFHTSEFCKTIKQLKKLEEYLLHLFGNSPMEFFDKHMTSYSKIYKVLKVVPPKNQFDLIRDIFHRKYSKDIFDYELRFSEDFLKLVPIHLREPLIRKRLETNDDCIHLLELTESISLIKEKLRNCSNAQDRAKLIQALCKALLLNKDNEVLYDTIEFIYERYRNDTKSLQSFVSEISNWKKIEKLNEEHLKVLYQLAMYSNTSNYNSLYPTHTIINAYFYHLIENNKSFDNLLMQYLKYVLSKDYFYYDLFLGELKHVKILCEKVLDMMESFKDQKDAYKRLSCAVLHSIYDYNKNNRKTAIPLDKYKKYLEFSLEEDSQSGTIKYMLCDHIKRFEGENLYHYFWKDYSLEFEYNVLVWFIKNDIKQIEQNLESILSKYMNHPDKHFFLAWKNYATPEIKKKTIAHIEKVLSYEDVRKSSYFVAFLSHLDSNAFLRATEPFMPPENGILDGDDVGTKTTLQEAVVSSLVNISSKEVLTVIKKVCIGDYLKFGLKPLYNFLYNTKEIAVFDILFDLKQSAVSVRKHSFWLSRHLLPIEEAWMFVNKAVKSENNPSLRNVFFRIAAQIFIESRSEDKWNQVKSYFDIVNCDDTGLHDFLIALAKNIPTENISEFVQYVIDVLKKSKNKEYGKKLILLAKNVPWYVFKSVSTDLLKDVIGFTVKEILSNSDDCDYLWDFIIQNEELLPYALENVKTNRFDKSVGHGKHRSGLKKFLECFCKTVLKLSNMDHKNIVDTFASHWNVLPKHCLFQSNMLIKLTKAFYETEFALERFAEKINTILHEYVQEYDTSIITTFCSQLTLVCDFHEMNEENKSVLVEGILKANQHAFNYILAIRMLPTNEFPAEDNRNYKWVNVIKSLETYIKQKSIDDRVIFHFDDYILNIDSDR